MEKTKKLSICAVLISLALVLSYVERFFPLQMIVPLPGIKLGLANIVTLVALYYLDWKSTYVIILIRCLLGAIFSGSVSGLFFSLIGGVFSVSVMLLVKKISCFSIYGVSILGAAAHNIGQIIAAIILMQSIYIGSYLPYLLIVALFTGCAMGSVTAGVLKVILRTGGTFD